MAVVSRSCKHIVKPTGPGFHYQAAGRILPRKRLVDDNQEATFP